MIQMSRQIENKMVAQDSSSSDDRDDSIVTFEQLNLEKKFEKKISSNKTVVQKKKCHTTIQEELKMNLHILQNTPEKRSLQRTEHVDRPSWQGLHVHKGGTIHTHSYVQTNKHMYEWIILNTCSLIDLFCI